jgi:hypothetical protein
MNPRRLQSDTICSITFGAVASAMDISRLFLDLFLSATTRRNQRFMRSRSAQNKT